MARTVVTHITDDIDGSKDAEEVVFAFDGVEYSIDLNKKNRAALEKALKPYVEAGRRLPKSTQRRRSSATSRPASGVDLAAVRQWAESQGIEVSSRGRVAQSVIDQYTAANGKG